MLIRLAGTVDDSIVDGPGFRFAVFTQGCKHNCPGCHNPETHDFAGGNLVDCDDLLQQIQNNPLLDGITLTGGDPFEQPIPCAYLSREVKKMGLNVWAYSGYLFEELLAKPECREFVEACDVIVDGPFILAQRTLELRFRGSRNQRLIDVQKSLREGTTVLYPLDPV